MGQSICSSPGLVTTFFFFSLPSSNLLLINFLSKLVLFFFCKKIKKVTCLVIYLENITYTCCCIYSLAQTFLNVCFLVLVFRELLILPARCVRFLAVSLSVVCLVKHTVHLVKCHSLLRQIWVCASINAKMVAQGLLLHQNAIRCLGAYNRTNLHLWRGKHDFIAIDLFK